MYLGETGEKKKECNGKYNDEKWETLRMVTQVKRKDD